MRNDIKATILHFMNDITMINNEDGSPSVKLFRFNDISDKQIRLSVDIFTNEWHILITSNTQQWSRAPLINEDRDNCFNYICPFSIPFWTEYSTVSNKPTTSFIWLNIIINNIKNFIKKENDKRMTLILSKFSTETMH